jgi:hypothetical protein
MARHDFDELVGRIDAVGWAVMLLSAELEMTGRLDGQHYGKSLQRRAENQEAGGLLVCARMLESMAEMLDSARQSREQRAESPGD